MPDCGCQFGAAAHELRPRQPCSLLIPRREESLAYRSVDAERVHNSVVHDAQRRGGVLDDDHLAWEIAEEVMFVWNAHTAWKNRFTDTALILAVLAVPALALPVCSSPATSAETAN